MAKPYTTQHLEPRIRELMLSGIFQIYDIWYKLKEEGDTTIKNHVTLWRCIRRVEQQLVDDGYELGWHKITKSHDKR